MFEAKGFFDYCINEKCVTDGNFKQTAKLLVEMGYRTIAINQVVDDTNCEPKKKKKKGESRDISDIVPTPVDVKSINEFKELKILNRLTIIFSSQELIHKIVKSSNFKKYDIIAVLPTTQAAFQFLPSIDADLVSFDSESKLPYKPNRRMYNVLIEKGYHFEILYTPAIQDSTRRKNTIHISHLYHAFGKSKNIIISSGAENHLQIRGPYDIINLGIIFGLSKEQAKNCITHYGRQVYINSVGRRHGKAVMFIENINETVNATEETDNATDDDMEVDQPAQKKTKQ